MRTRIETQGQTRIPELDGIRGLAIGMVVLYHYFLLTLPPRPGTAVSYALAAGRLSWSGVDLFFVLSGFLIGGILLDARDSSNYFRVFYTRRFFRIVPLYGAVLMLSFLLTWALTGGLSFLQEGMLEGPQVPWLTYPLFLQNFWMAARSNLGGWNLGATWSLAVEEQFYFTLPLLIRVLSLRSLTLVLAMGALGAPVLRVLLLVLWPTHPLSWMVLMPCKADTLLLGVLAALALRTPSWREWLEKSRRVMFSLLIFLAGGLGVITWRYFDREKLPMVSVGFTWLAVFYACLLLCAVLYGDSWLAKGLRWRWLGWLGSIAYGVYLVHDIVRTALLGRLRSGEGLIHSWNDGLLTLVALGVTLLVCRASWIYFEQPLVKKGHRARYERENAQVDEPRLRVAIEGGRG